MSDEQRKASDVAEALAKLREGYNKLPELERRQALVKGLGRVLLLGGSSSSDLSREQWRGLTVAQQEVWARANTHHIRQLVTDVVMYFGALDELRPALCAELMHDAMIEAESSLKDAAKLMTALRDLFGKKT